MVGLISLGASVLIAVSIAVSDARSHGGLEMADLPEYELLNLPMYFELSRSRKANNSTSKPETVQTNGLCTCKSGACKCCTGPVLDLFSQKACMRILYTPEDFAFDFSMLLNNRVMYQNRISGKNPAPVCIGIPQVGGLKVCARFSNIYFAGRNLHVCMGMEGHWNYFELFSLSFDCIRMGSAGISFLKPEDGGGAGINGGLDAVIDAGDDIEDYDENVVRSIITNRKTTKS